MYRIHLSNIGHWSAVDFGTVADAKRYGIEKGFDFSVWWLRGGDPVNYPVGSWSIIGGWRDADYSRATN